MTDGRRRDEWDRLSYLLATLINGREGRRGKAVKPGEVNAFLLAEKESRRPIRRRKPSEVQF